ncbi:MAG: DUF4407 domain-containing protein [Bacteroidia bacterium]
MNIRKSLCTLSGDDYSIIRKCPLFLQNLFAMIGGLVSCIFVICFISSFFTFTKLFQSYYIGIPVSIFFAWMITNIYLLLLYTLTKNVLPHVKNRRAKYISIGVRLLFICFISVVVSKPLESLLFSNQLKIEIEKYRVDQIEKYTALTNSYFENENKQLQEIVDKQLKIYGSSPLGMTDQYFAMIKRNESKRYELVAKMTKLVNESNYYIQSIIILNKKYPACWLISILSTLIFLAPAYMKNYIGEESQYYDFKRKIETELIQIEYASFKSQYNVILQRQCGKNILFSEQYVDAPFNTVRKKDSREFLKEEDLILELYNA